MYRWLVCWLSIAMIVVSREAFAKLTYRDAMGASEFPSFFSPSDGWMPDQNGWADKNYPISQTGGFIPGCWPGGSLKLRITNDGPALQGSKLTVKSKTTFPRDMWVAKDGQLCWEHGVSSRVRLRAIARRRATASPECKDTNNNNHNNNWGPWPPDQNSSNLYPVYPDGKLIQVVGDHYHQREFVYVWHTQGSYYQTLGGTDASVVLDTATMAVGTFPIRVLVFHEGSQGGRFCPLANVSANYTITDVVHLTINVSQSGDRNPKDNVFLAGKAVKLKATPYDPTGYLKNANVTYSWDFGDGTVKPAPDENGGGNEHTNPADHTYTTGGVFRISVEVQAVIPTPCGVLNSTVLPDLAPQRFYSPEMQAMQELGEAAFREDNRHWPFPTSTATTVPPSPSLCQVVRHGRATTAVKIVQGIKNLQVAQTLRSTNSTNGLDLTITCQGSVPTEVCTVVADELCLKTHSSSCVILTLPGSSCAFVLHQEFNSSGVYCLNITLYDAVGISATSNKLLVTAQPESNAGYSHVLGPAVVAGGMLPMMLVVILGVYAYKRSQRRRSTALPCKVETYTAPSRVHFMAQVGRVVSRKTSSESNPLLDAYRHRLV